MVSGVFVSSIILGLVFSATPGAVNTLSLRRGAIGGYWPAALVQLGSLAGDVLWAAVALTGLAFLTRNHSITLLLGIVGACFILRQALSAFRGAARGQDSTAAPRVGMHFATGALFSLTNPFAIPFWLGLGASAAATAHGSLPAAAVFLGGFLSGAIVWCLGFPALVSAGRRHINPRVLRAIDALAGTVLTFFGARLLWRSIQGLQVLRYVRILVG